MRVLIFDVEATGTTRPQVCQLALIMCEGGNIRARNYFFAVDAMNSYAYRVHHLSMSALKRLSGGLRFGDMAGEIMRELRCADVYAGHGVAGDIDYLRREFTRLGMNMPQRRRLCTMHYFTGRCGGALLPSGKPKPPRLSELWAHYGLTEAEISAFAEDIFGGGSGAHDARFDAAATYLALVRAISAGDAPRELL